jgi:hypothetical protein
MKMYEFSLISLTMNFHKKCISPASGKEKESMEKFQALIQKLAKEKKEMNPLKLHGLIAELN